MNSERGAQPAVFIAWAIDMPQSTAEERVAALQNTALPRWRDLVHTGKLVERVVLEDIDGVKSGPDLPAWTQLHLAQVAPGVDARTLIREEEDADRQAGLDGTVVRVEVLEASPRSFHPGPPAAVYGIEYIQVDDPFLDEYREHMRLNNGPTVKAAIAEGAAVSFAALETVDVAAAHLKARAWNQIHVLGYDSSKQLQEFLPVFRQCLQRVNPDCGGFERVFGRLQEIRTHAKFVHARDVPELRCTNVQSE